MACINTDDPAVEGIEIEHEYLVAAPQAGLSQADIEKAQANALEIAYLSYSDKKALLTMASTR